MGTAGGTVIDAPAVRAMLRRRASVVSTPTGDQGGDGRRRRGDRRVRDRRRRVPRSSAAPPPTTWSTAPLRTSSPPRTSTSPSPTPTPPPRRSSCAPASSRPSCASATSTIFGGPANGWPPSPPATSDARRRTAAATLAEELPVYNGLVEAARTNSRLGHVVGAAYLRRRLGLMRHGDPAGGDDRLRGRCRAARRSVPRRHAAIVGVASWRRPRRRPCWWSRSPSST